MLALMVCLVHLDATLDVRCYIFVNSVIESLPLARRSNNDVAREALKFVEIIYCKLYKKFFLESGV